MNLEPALDAESLDGKLFRGQKRKSEV